MNAFARGFRENAVAVLGREGPRIDALLAAREAVADVVPHLVAAGEWCTKTCCDQQQGAITLGLESARATCIVPAMSG